MDKIRIEEQRHSKNLVMSLREAQDLHTDITKLLLALQEITNNNTNEEVIQVELNPGNKWE